ncbi:hypothetical protein CC80DRAFT_552228 [Byssothecium circinans]|uniref:Uncharacterized protein n=1 Tax=Byssothecium circinans TaxID=147558 RepID=A0A6A5TLX7_9PLEO|nr:hypothetical protein CC80DRAFT_552228 [Byssothecium circinans]
MIIAILQRSWFGRMLLKKYELEDDKISAEALLEKDETVAPAPSPRKRDVERRNSDTVCRQSATRREWRVLSIESGGNNFARSNAYRRFPPSSAMDLYMPNSHIFTVKSATIVCIHVSSSNSFSDLQSS